jgi:TetR/AcrR family transcriptional regulator, regulator of cefoperazone and chloramphenicol sensitivity
MSTTPRSSPRRQDGAATREQLLRAACEIFAEHGFDRASGRQITSRAGANVAAINYHFGGFEALYAEVLAAAHAKIVGLDDLIEIEGGHGHAATKLRALIDLAVQSVTSLDETNWALRILRREFQAPSPAFHILEDREMLPKRAAARRLVAEIAGWPEDDPRVGRIVLSILSPVDAVLLGDPDVMLRSYTALSEEPAAATKLAEHLFAFALGGVAAVTGKSDLLAHLPPPLKV